MNFSVTNHLFNILTTIFKMKTKLDCLKLINFIEKSIDFKKIFYPVKYFNSIFRWTDSALLCHILYFKKNGTLILCVYCNHNWTHSTKASSTAFDILQNLNLPFYFVDSKEL
jgi:hypothetical protein